MEYKKKMESVKKKEISLGVIFSYLTIIVQCLSGIIYTPIILHSLGQGEYGIYSLCTSFSGYLTIFNAGMNAAFVRFYVQTKTTDELKLPSLNGVFFRIFAVMATFSLIMGLAISWNAEMLFGTNITSHEYVLLKQLFIILAFTAFATVINCIFSSFIIANERFIFAKSVNLIQIILAPVLTIPLLIKGYGAIAVFLIKFFLIVAIVLFNAYYSFFKLKIKIAFKRVDRDLLKSILIFAGAIAIQSIMDQLNWQVDKFVLAWTNGTKEISVYSVGSTLNTYYIMITSAMSNLFIAEINRLVARGKNKELSDLFIKTSRIFAFLVFLIMSGYCIFGKIFILRWAGIEYEMSYYVGLLLMLPITVSLTMGLGQDIMRAKNIHKQQIFINIAVTFFNFLISIPLAIKFGAVGSALGTFLCEIIICVIVQSIYYSKVGKLDMKAYYREMMSIIPGLILPVAYGLIVTRRGIVKYSYFSIGFYAFIYICIYFVCMWFFGMNNYEKNLVKRAIKRVIVNIKGQ